MATSYKTPGVYVEEISIFPPSITQVETAVPAFIGYTERHSLLGRDLKLNPTEITSLAEFEEAFGKGHNIEVDSIELDNSNNVSRAALKSGFLLYDSLRLFFSNGGSKCYIISIGEYPAEVGDADPADFEAGLAELSKEDEPTLILFPDAVLLSDNALYDLQKAALMQSKDLGDRFVIMDLYPTTPTEDLDMKVDEFRDHIGIRNLEYGAAYVPYLRSNLDKNISYRHLAGKIKRGAATVDLKGLATDSETITSIDKLENAISDVNEFKDLLGSDGIDGIEAGYLAKENAFKTAINDPGETLANQRTAFREVLEYLYNQLTAIPDVIAANASSDFSSHTPSGGEKKQRYLIDDTIDSIGGGTLYAAALELNALAQHTDPRIAATTDANAIKSAIDMSALTSADWGGFTDIGDVDAYYSTDTTGLTGDALSNARRANMREGVVHAGNVLKTLLAGLSELEDAAAGFEKTYESALVATFPLLKTIIKRAENSVTELPPSGAIAGVYSSVDANRGVFKAPANISLNRVSGVTTLISHDEQRDLNVDVVAGKSINAIRPFTGKGILVWGARTLAGNDNEWRYISVRRFFNMVEESTKKATERFVFEPNDATTWTKVKTMIENFLINQWRGGALAGSTPEQAFFVKVGLGQTMTAQDVLEGRMIVEIGMAAVRPAEFIILRFSHKMQEA